MNKWWDKELLTFLVITFIVFLFNLISEMEHGKQILHYLVIAIIIFYIAFVYNKITRIIKSIDVEGFHYFRSYSFDKYYIITRPMLVMCSFIIIFFTLNKGPFPYNFFIIGIIVIVIWIIVKFDNHFNETSDLAKDFMKQKV